MAKPVKTIVKIQIKGGEASPVPPVGTALGPQGINLQDFCSIGTIILNMRSSILMDSILCLKLRATASSYPEYV